MCFVRLKTPLLEKTNRLSPVSSAVSECCSQGPVSADGCPSLRIKKERKREHKQQTGSMQTAGERKVKCNDMWWWFIHVVMDGSASPDPALTTSFIQKERKDKASTCQVFSLSYSADCLLTVHQTLQNRPTSY